MTTHYTIVYTDYHIEIFHTFKALWDFLVRSSADPLEIVSDPYASGFEEDKTPMTMKGLKKNLSKSGAFVRLYYKGNDEWLYRIQRHNQP